LCHLFALGLYVVAAPSGPWPAGMGVNMAQGPQFAVTINDFLTPYYLRPLKMTHNYHFQANRTAFPGVMIQIKLKDEKGKLIETVQLPDPKANFWVQHRQLLLARGLGEDQPVEPPGSDKIPGVGKKTVTVEIWDAGGTGQGAEWQLVIKSTPEHLIPRDRPVMRPSAYSRTLARSYVRYLCRQTGAATGEVLRTSRDPIIPALLVMEDTPPGTFNNLVSNFGEMPR
jgi:hypothetical protein